MNFEMEDTNILETKVYKLTREEKVPGIKKWLGHEGLHLMQTFTHKEEEKSRNMKGSYDSIVQ